LAVRAEARGVLHTDRSCWPLLFYRLPTARQPPHGPFNRRRL